MVEAEAHISDHLGQLWILAPEAATSAGLSDALVEHVAVGKRNGPRCFKVNAQHRCTHSLHIELACALVLKHTKTELLKDGINKNGKQKQYCGSKWNSGKKHAKQHKTNKTATSQNDGINPEFNLAG